MFGLGNWVKQSVSAGGTGNLTVASVTGFDTFASQFGDGTTTPPARYFRYVISDGNNFETGIGHMSATTTLVRDLIEMKIDTGTMSRYPGAGLTVSTSAFVYCDYAAQHEPLPYVANAASTTGGVGAGYHQGSYATAAFSMPNFVYMPFFLPLSGIYSGITWHFSSIGTATKCRFGVYDVATNGKPGTQILTTADISGASLATGDHNTSFSASAYLAAGWLYLAFVADAAITWNNRNVYATTGQGPAGVFTNGQDIYTFYDSAVGWTTLPATATGANNGTTPYLPLFSLTRSV